MDGNSENGLHRDLSVSIAKANVYGFLFGALPAILIARLYLWLWGYEGIRDGFFLVSGADSLFVFYAAALAVLLCGTVAHELIHGLAWAYFSGRPLRSIRFGFQLKTLTPYAHSKEPMQARAYRIGVVMPGLLLGLLPSLIGLATGNGWLTLFGLFFALAAGGDLLVLWLIRKVGPESLVEDHPSRAGCYLFIKDSRNI